MTPERGAGLRLREPTPLAPDRRLNLRANAWGEMMTDQTDSPNSTDEGNRARRDSMTQTLIRWLADDDVHNLIILVALILLGIWVWLR